LDHIAGENGLQMHSNEEEVSNDIARQQMERDVLARITDDAAPAPKPMAKLTRNASRHWSHLSLSLYSANTLSGMLPAPEYVLRLRFLQSVNDLSGGGGEEIIPLVPQIDA
jgi:hypothetical protein